MNGPFIRKVEGLVNASRPVNSGVRWLLVSRLEVLNVGHSRQDLLIPAYLFKSSLDHSSSRNMAYTSEATI
jgi:hypothetical protein